MRTKNFDKDNFMLLDPLEYLVIPYFKPYQLFNQCIPKCYTVYCIALQMRTKER